MRHKACQETAAHRFAIKEPPSPRRNGKEKEELRAIDLLTGGCVFRSRPQLIFANHLCCFTSEAPLLLPRRLDSRLSKSREIASLHALIASRGETGVRPWLEHRRESEMKYLRRYFGSVSESDWEVHDILEGIVPLFTFERSSRVLGIEERTPSAGGNCEGIPKEVDATCTSEGKYAQSSRRSGCRVSTSQPLTYGHQS